MEQITYEKRDAIATIALNRPDALNAITPTMMHELHDALVEANTDAGVAVVVLTGTGRAFSAGVDLKSLGKQPITNGAVGAVLDDPGRQILGLMETMPKIVIGKVNGFCFTGALELLLACDLIVTAAEAKFGDTHARWGVRPSWGMSQRLPRRVGMLKARELSYTARSFTGVEAAAIGLANAAVPLADLDAHVSELARQVAANSTGVVAAYKDMYRQTEGMTLDEGLAYEANTTYSITDTSQRLEEFMAR